MVCFSFFWRSKICLIYLHVENLYKLYYENLEFLVFVRGLIVNVLPDKCVAG